MCPWFRPYAPVINLLLSLGAQVVAYESMFLNPLLLPF